MSTDGHGGGEGIAHLRVVTVLNARRAWVTVLLPQGEERFEPGECQVIFRRFCS